MSRNHTSVDARWWYATVAIVVLLVLYVTQSPPDSSLFLFGLNVITPLVALFCLVMDTGTV